MDEKIFANAGQWRRGLTKVNGYSREIIEGAAEVFLVGQDGQRAGGGVAVALGLGRGGDAGGDGTGGGRSALYLGDYGELAVRAPKRSGERGYGGQRGVERGEFGERHRPDLAGDLDALPGHDFGELVGHEGANKHAVTTEDKAEKSPARLDWSWFDPSHAVRPELTHQCSPVTD